MSVFVCARVVCVCLARVRAYVFLCCCLFPYLFPSKIGSL